MTEQPEPEESTEPVVTEETEAVVPQVPDANRQTCPSCGELGSPGDKWCEACGADFAGEFDAVDGPPCVDCGAPHAEIFEGYCSECGRKQPAERDHFVEVLGKIVAVTDRGKRHHHNEDHFAIGSVGDTHIAIVCDGVSTTDNPEEASLLAAAAARDSLVTDLKAGSLDIEAALATAIAAAQDAASSVDALPNGQGPASTTIVATVVAPDSNDPSMLRSWTAWLGDSRAYWVQQDPNAPTGTFVATQLMTDDVLGPSISRWLGADAGDTTPTIQGFEHDAGTSQNPAMLLSCSDGLWKYAAEPSEIAELVSRLAPTAETTLDLAEALVAFANEQGGHDNTTVVIVRT